MEKSGEEGFSPNWKTWSAIVGVSVLTGGTSGIVDLNGHISKEDLAKVEKKIEQVEERTSSAEHSIQDIVRALDSVDNSLDHISRLQRQTLCAVNAPPSERPKCLEVQ